MQTLAAAANGGGSGVYTDNGKQFKSRSEKTLETRMTRRNEYGVGLHFSNVYAERQWKKIALHVPLTYA